jgi:hypothetical protein
MRLTRMEIFSKGILDVRVEHYMMESVFRVRASRRAFDVILSLLLLTVNLTVIKVTLVTLHSDSEFQLVVDYP